MQEQLAGNKQEAKCLCNLAPSKGQPELANAIDIVGGGTIDHVG